MRDIKFRAWDGEKMLSDGLIFCSGSWFLSGRNFEDWIPTVAPIMQYTGLKDKNGVEIYEGDLLRFPAKDKYKEKTYNCFEVFYHGNECIGGQNIGFCMNRMHTQGNSAGGRGYKFWPSVVKDFEIIGNIYENPELVKA